jgi:ribonucleotide monophosphatase NagD (HAD superfamily)
MNNAKTDVELATSYGRNSRRVFGGETWDEALDRIKAAWEMIPVDLDWAIALPRIRAGWDMGPPDPLG